MFSMPTSFSDFVIKCIRTVPYVAVLNGTIFFLIGSYMVWSAASFNSRATERGNNGQVYRPWFEATATNGKKLRYSGYTWVYPKPHNQGDVVAGLVDWPTGEMRSISMTEWSKTFGKMSASIGGIIFLTGGAYICWKRKRT